MPEIPLGIWRHYKGGYYEVIAVAVHASTADSYVIYRNPEALHFTWTRSAEEFLAPVEFFAGAMVPRFTYVRPANSPAIYPR